MHTFTFPISQERYDALFQRGLDDIVAFIQARGILVEGVSLHADPLSLSVVADVDPSQALLDITWKSARDYRKAAQYAKGFAELVDRGDTPTTRQITLAIRALIELIDVD